MSHPSEEELVLYLYGETKESDFLRGHVESCVRCQGELSLLRQVLAEVDEVTPPERGPDYEARVWERVSKDLPRRKSSRRYIWLAAAASLLLATFLAGRFSARPPADDKGARSSDVRERILLVALSEHFAQSQMLLLEVVNRGEGAKALAPIDRERAGELLQASRLYRQTAYQVGEITAGDVLEELERILLDVSQGPETLESREALKARIEGRDLLFKLRVLGSTVRKF